MRSGSDEAKVGNWSRSIQVLGRRIFIYCLICKFPLLGIIWETIVNKKRK